MSVCQSLPQYQDNRTGYPLQTSYTSTRDIYKTFQITLYSVTLTFTQGCRTVLPYHLNGFFKLSCTRTLYTTYTFLLNMCAFLTEGQN